ncbi:hypothetical protein GEMRC1_004396 [Eukaryota sp. GEM-RC1]
MTLNSGILANRATTPPAVVMTLISRLRTYVSQSRVRYQDGEFDLDLTYVTPNIIAMGFPAEGFMSTWRNDIADVAKMLDKYHPHHYMIFNLSEKSYDSQLFQHCVLDFGFPDHHPPPLSLLFSIVSSMHRWIRSDALNVAVIHCKAGKGRTGVVISCYFLFTRQASNHEDALMVFANARSKSSVGVQNPSQIRYVQYFEQALNAEVVPYYVSFSFLNVVFPVLKHLDLRHGFMEIYQNYKLIAKVPIVKSNSVYGSFPSHPITISDDILIKIVNVVKKQPKKILRVAFNTGFLFNNLTQLYSNNYIYRFSKDELDGPHKSDLFPSDFYLEIRLELLEKGNEVPEWFNSLVSKRSG